MRHRKVAAGERVLKLVVDTTTGARRSAAGNRDAVSPLVRSPERSWLASVARRLDRDERSADLASAPSRALGRRLVAELIRPVGRDAGSATLDIARHIRPIQPTPLEAERSAPSTQPYPSTDPVLEEALRLALGGRYHSLVEEAERTQLCTRADLDAFAAELVDDLARLYRGDHGPGARLWIPDRLPDRRSGSSATADGRVHAEHDGFRIGRR